MFVARTHELESLEELYRRSGFQMVVVYGRRRIGKTSLIDEFVKDKRTLYYTGQLRSSLLNLQELSRIIYGHFGLPASTPSFATWSDALSFVAEQAGNERIVFVIDELPYAARTEPGLPSALQVAIDHGFKQGNVFMILCGSNEGFMESEVLGRKSPLYGRRTGQIHLGPFDYLDAARMLPELDCRDLVQLYATFGGTPHYLAQIDPHASYEHNIARLMFDKTGMLYEEPMMLLRQELREPAAYNSVLSAIAAGSTEPSRIADAAGIEQRSIGKYLRTLIGLGLVVRQVPFGENAVRSKKGAYMVADPFLAFWYRFVEPSLGAIELGAGAVLANQLCTGQVLPSYVGRQFELIALQWVARENRAGRLPFLATEFGRWWGTDPQEREEIDIDLIAANRQESAALFCECKWRNDFNETEAIATLERRSRLVGKFRSRTYALVTKYPVSAATQAKADQRGDLILASADDLFAAQA